MYNLIIFFPTLFLSMLLLPYIYLKPPPALSIQNDEWWGPANGTATDDIVPFQVEFDNATIAALRSRLNTTHFVTPLVDVAFEYGFNGNQLQQWVQYWGQNYSFSERQNYLNKYPQYKTNIQGLDIHFIRVKPTNVPNGTEVVPVLMLPGFPGGVIEYYEALPHLTAISSDRDYALEIILVSLPGSGYSSGAARPGLGVDKIAVVCRNLMQRLGFTEYYLQGGDWGAMVTKTIATLYPEECLGHHTNLPFVMKPGPILSDLQDFLTSFYRGSSDQQNATLAKSQRYLDIIEDIGFLHIQANKPDTIGMALTDSPAGDVAYILERYVTGSRISYRHRSDGGLTQFFTKDQLLDIVSVIYFTNSLTTYMRIYAETFNNRYFNLQHDSYPTDVPTIATQAKEDFTATSTATLKEKFPNLINNTFVDDLGHFQAFEKPEPFSINVIEAIGEFRTWHKNNSN